MSLTKVLAMIVLSTGCLAAQGSQKAVEKVLDDFHLAASQADGRRYFAHFAKGGVFLGTDASERWSVAEFKKYAGPYFSKGKGWTYLPLKRHVRVEGNVAWFDENLKNEKLGLCRGSGVLVKEGGKWKVAQYNLTIPIPNSLALKVTEMISEEGKKSEKK